MDNDEFEAYLKENKFEQLFNPFDSITCQYYDENEFISANRNGEFLHAKPWIPGGELSIFTAVIH